MFCVNVRFLPSDSSEPVTKLYRLPPVEDGKADGSFESPRVALEEDGISWDRVCIWRRELHARPEQFLISSCWNVFAIRFTCRWTWFYCPIKLLPENLVYDIYHYFKNAPNRQSGYEDFHAFTQCEPNKMAFRSVVRQLHFTDVLGDLTGLNKLFLPDRFKLRRMLPEVELVFRTFLLTFIAKSTGPWRLPTTTLMTNLNGCLWIRSVLASLHLRPCNKRDHTKGELPHTLPPLV